MSKERKSHREALAKIIGAEVERNEQGRTVGFRLDLELRELVSIHKVIPRKAGGLFDYEAYNAYECHDFMDEVYRSTGIHPYDNAQSLPGKLMIAGLNEDGEYCRIPISLPYWPAKDHALQAPSRARDAP